MVLCPVALAIGCRKCPVFAVCPLKSTIGDYAPPDSAASTRDAPRAARKAGGAKKPAGDKAKASDGQRRNARRRS
jgi:hypothetical protein